MYSTLLSKKIVRITQELAEIWGVSEVARSRSGFTSQYLSHSVLSDFWMDKREAFIVRHRTQMENQFEPFWIKIDELVYPSPRHLALIMWAYSPFPEHVEEFAEQLRDQLRHHAVLPGRPKLSNAT